MAPAKKTPTVADQVADMVPVAPVDVEPVPSEDSVKEVTPNDQRNRLQANAEGEMPVARNAPQMPPEVAQAAATGNLDPEVARVIAEMQTTIANLESRVNSANVDKGDGADEDGASGYPWQYYVKPNMGPEANWVISGPGGSAKGGRRNAAAYANSMSRGMRPLVAYGVAPVPSSAPLPGQPFWNMIEAGGAKEFPAAQVLAYKWHQNPPVAGIVFPQYEAVKDTVLEFQCDECELEISFEPTDTLAPRACFNHLRNTHDYPRSEAKAAMDAQGIKTIAPYAIRREARELADDRLKVAPTG